MDIQHIYTTYQNCIISNKLTCTHCVCAFVVLQLQSLPYLNREWYTALSTAIVESFFFDIVRLQTTNQMLLCFLTQLSCNVHVHMHMHVLHSYHAMHTCTLCHTCNYMGKCVHHMHTMYTPILKNQVNKHCKPTLYMMCASEHC